MYHTLNTNGGVPEEVVTFAERQMRKYAPAPVFVMDIGQSADKLYVIEVGCFHSAGFYSADVVKIVDAVSQYITNNYYV